MQQETEYHRHENAIHAATDKKRDPRSIALAGIHFSHERNIKQKSRLD